MEPTRSRCTSWIIIVAGALVVLALALRPRPDPNTELARTTREAVAMAREAQADNRSAVLWAGRFRLLAIAVGVGTPIVIVFLIWRASASSELDPVEVIDASERYAVSGSAPPARLDTASPAETSVTSVEHDCQ